MTHHSAIYRHFSRFQKGRRKEHALNRALACIDAVNRALLHAETESDLFSQVCDAVIGIDGYRMAWIGEKKDDPEKSIVPLAHAGIEEGYLTAVRFNWSEDEHGRGPAGGAVRMGLPILFRDMESNPDFDPWREQARRRGYHSAIALPLQQDGDVFGVFVIYGAEVDAFDSDTCELLQKLANHIDASVATLRARKNIEQARLIIEASPVVLFRWAAGHPWRIDYVSDNVRQFGYEAAAIMDGDIDFADLIAPEDRGHVEEEVARYLSEGHLSFTQTYQILCGNGEKRWVRNETTVKRDDTGSVTGLQGLVIDITEQKKYEIALKESEERFRDFASAAAEWFWETDAELKPTYISPRFELATGLPRDLFLGCGKEEFIVRRDHRGTWRRHLLDVEARRPFKAFHFTVRTDDGNDVHLSISGIPMFGEDGNFLGYRGTGTNITSRVEAEQSANMWRERLEDAIENISEAFILRDSEDKFVLCNGRYHEYFEDISHLLIPGTPFKDIISTAVEMGLRPQAKGREEEYLREQLGGRLAGIKPIERQLANGRWILISDRLTDHGEIVGIRTDITDIKEREEALRVSEIRYRELFENMRDGAAILEAAEEGDDFVFKNFNRAAEEIEKVSRDEVVGRRVSEVFPGVDTMGLLPVYRRVWQTGRAEFFPASLYVDDRISGWRENFILRLPTDELVVIFADVTREKQHDEELRRANAKLEIRVVERTKELNKAKQEAEAASQAKTDFLAKMSHELRTPLNAIIGYSDAILEGIFGTVADHKFKECVGDIKKSGDHLMDLINDILDVATIESGHIGLSEQALDPLDLTEAAVGLVKPRAERKAVTLNTKYKQPIPKLHGDRRRIKQVLVNLLTNAVKFTRGSGTVLVTVKTSATGGLHMAISDSGIGMDEADIAIALTEFGQVTNDLVDHCDGTGLGLPLSKQLIEAHGGRLEIHSSLGVGTTVDITFPPERSIWSEVRQAETV